MKRAQAALALSALLIANAVVWSVASAAPTLTDAERLDILWADYCDRTEDTRCLPPATPTPSPSPTPSATPSPAPSASPSPTPSPAAPTATASSTPTLTPPSPPSPSASPAPAGTATAEAQAWWSLDGFDIPDVVGHHVHLRVTYPTGIVNGRVTFPVRVTLHDQVGGTSWLRLQAVTPSGSNVQRYMASFELGGCHDCFRDTSISVDTSGWPTGRHELRFTANVPDEQPDVSGSQRMFESTGIQLCVRSCTPTYRSGDFLEARGWYDNSPNGENHEYQNARLTSPLSSIRSGGTIRVRLGPGSGGLATKGAGVYIDPSFHDANPGIVVREWSGPYTGDVKLPTLSSGAHRLVLIAHDGQNGGVLQVPFDVP